LSNEIESNKILIRDAFEWWYRVPDYQRPYVWGLDQVNELLDDVAQWGMSRPDSEYFLGSIVLQKRESNGIVEYDLLDGQQRLTTCLLIHAVGRDLTRNEELKKSCRDMIYKEANRFKRIPEQMRIVYDIRDEVQEFINEYIKADSGTQNDEGLKAAQNADDISVRNLANAVLEIRRYFTETEDFDLEDFFDFFLNNVLLVYVSSPSLDDAFRMFTVLNDRGMKLRGSDILKTINLRALNEKEASDAVRRKWAKYWEELEGELGDDFDVFLSHVRSVLVKDKARLSLLQEFEDNIYQPKVFDKQRRVYIDTPPLLTPGLETFEFIERYHRHYQDIFNGNHYQLEKSWRFDNLITLLGETALADFWLPPLLHYREVFGEYRIQAFLRKLENKFCGDWITYQTPTDRIRGMNQITALIDTLKTHTDLRKEQQVEILLDADVFEYDRKRFFQILEEDDIYSRRFARYILFKLDVLYASADARLQRQGWLSVEHVLPQTPTPESQWCKDFTEEEREVWTHRLGNLILLSRRKNSSQGRLDFSDKKSRYFKDSVELFPNSLRVMQVERWDLEALRANHQEVLDKLRGYC